MTCLFPPQQGRVDMTGTFIIARQALLAGTAIALAATPPRTDTFVALYAEVAALSTVQNGTINGRAAIESFWVRDFGGKKPASTLTLTDVYLAGDLAHLEGDYKVTDSGRITDGRYIQLWMRDADGWRIHREMWWR